MILTLQIAPQTKQRPRTGKGRIYTAEKTRRYESKIRELTRHLERLEGDLSLDATFVFKRPKSFPKRIKGRQARSGVPDVDNLLKALCDGLQGSLVSNDSSFVELTGRKVYGAQGEPPCIELLINPYDINRSPIARAIDTPKQRILSALRTGATCRQAALMSSVAESTFYRWKKEDEDFARQVEFAILSGEGETYTKLLKAVEEAEDWRGYAWILERRFSERWGANNHLRMSVTPDTAGLDRIQEAIANIRKQDKELGA